MTLVPLPYRLVSRRRETADTVTFELQPVGAGLEPFAPGQYAMLYAFGVGEIPVSVCRMAGDGRLTHTVRAVGAVSLGLCDLPIGASVGVRGPFGTGWNLTAARGHDLLVVAGGIGLAPLRPLIDAVLAEPAAYGRLNVLVGARSPDDLGPLPGPGHPTGCEPRLKHGMSGRTPSGAGQTVVHLDHVVDVLHLRHQPGHHGVRHPAGQIHDPLAHGDGHGVTVGR